MTMRRVVMESPYAGKTQADIDHNVAYARECLADCLSRGESPMAGHLLFTQVLDDTIPAERRKGLNAHLSWITSADDLVVYTDLGISSGMQEAIVMAQEHKAYIIFRTLPKKKGKVKK